MVEKMFIALSASYSVKKLSSEKQFHRPCFILIPFLLT